MALEAWLPYVAAVLLFAAAGYFAHRLRDRPEAYRSMLPLAIYIAGVGLFFALDGFSVFATTSCPGIDCTDLSSAIAVVLGASFVARYRLREVWPAAEVWVTLGLVWVMVVVETLAAVRAPALVLPLAFTYAIFVVGTFVVGTLAYQLLLRRDEFDPWSPNVAALGLVLVATLPLIGIALEMLTVSVLLSPLPLAGAYVFFERVQFAGDVTPGLDADATP